jgi:uncharacterized DUF497 family protein
MMMEARKVVWDSKKDIINRREHGIGFDIAQLVFGDPYRVERRDQSEGEYIRGRTLADLGQGRKDFIRRLYETRRDSPFNIGAPCKQGREEKL